MKYTNISSGIEILCTFSGFSLSIILSFQSENISLGKNILSVKTYHPSRNLFRIKGNIFTCQKKHALLLLSNTKKSCSLVYDVPVGLRKGRRW